MRIPLLLYIAFLGFGCKHAHEPVKVGQHKSIFSSFDFYSSSVRDSFAINVYVPDASPVKNPNQLPVIYVLDANLYFDIYVSILKKYSEVGLLPAAILVGIGYSSFEKMDSLRVRDYTFPVGLPEYEMPISGKADAFLQFMQYELVPMIDKKFSPDTSKRVLVGHSLGGYFAMYTLLKELSANKSVFSGFIAASPSLHYNQNYLLKQFDSVGQVTGSVKKVYVAYGDLENIELKSSMILTADEIFKKLAFDLSHVTGTKLKTATFSEMDHMDTQLPSFIKGLQWIVTDL